MYGMSFRYVWDVFEICMGCVSDMYGMCFRYVWHVLEKCVGCVRDIYETCLSGRMTILFPGMSIYVQITGFSSHLPGH